MEALVLADVEALMEALVLADVDALVEALSDKSLISAFASESPLIFVCP